MGPLEKLRILKLDTNQLDGTLLTEIGNLESLISLKLGNNNFVGELPEEWSALSRINTLWIENNPGITGTVPTSYGNLESLGKSNNRTIFFLRFQNRVCISRISIFLHGYYLLRLQNTSGSMEPAWKEYFQIPSVSCQRSNHQWYNVLP